MIKNNKLKAVVIIGVDHEESYKALANYYNSQDYLIIGDGRNSIRNSDFSTLRDRIDYNTRIDIIAHGKVTRDTHFISLKKSDNMLTEDFFANLRQLSGGAPLHINLWSCYGGAAAKDVASLSDGSLLISHSSAEYPNITWFTAKLIPIIVKMQESNEVSSPFQSLAENLSAYYSSPFTISVNLNLKPYSLSLTPDLINLFKNPLNELNTAFQKISLFHSKLLHKSGKDKEIVYFDGINLQPVNFNPNEIHDMLTTNFIYHCCMGDFNKIDEVIKSLPQDEVNKLINKNFSGFTSLYVASGQGHEKIVRLLLESNVNVNAGLNDGATPLYIASKIGRSEIVKLLLKYNANVNAELNNGATSLFAASRYGHEDVVELLLKYNATPSVDKLGGITPRMIAKFNGHDKIVKMLEQTIKKDANEPGYFIEKVTRIFVDSYIRRHEYKGVYSDYKCDNDIPIFSYQNEYGSELLICEPRNIFHDEL
ncbi:ankyrin repeat domain-containing protein [Holosporaceae bacterium 'Namur']|nr:ankyrin repeat domain-containing protein [Holosporaceae bacterium 'Namur']